MPFCAPYPEALCRGAAPHRPLHLPQREEDIHFSYLPLPHVFERMVLLGIYGQGSACGFWQGTPDKLLEDMQVSDPSVSLGAGGIR